MVENIRQIDNDEKLYNQYLNEPIFKKNIIPSCVLPKNVLHYIEEKILC